MQEYYLKVGGDTPAPREHVLVHQVGGSSVPPPPLPLPPPLVLLPLAQEIQEPVGPAQRVSGQYYLNKNIQF